MLGFSPQVVKPVVVVMQLLIAPQPGDVEKGTLGEIQGCL
jgi:hypothetical protein